MMILNYVVTSNHIHLIVYEKDSRETIPKSIQLLAGRGQGRRIISVKKEREQSWTRGIATGNRGYVESVKFQMGSFGVGRQIRNNGENFELRETQSPHNAVFDAEKNDIDGENLWFRNAEIIISAG